MPEFKNWLCKNVKNGKACCKNCEQSITSKVSVLKAHANSLIHLKNSNPANKDKKKSEMKSAAIMEMYTGMKHKG